MGRLAADGNERERVAGDEHERKGERERGRERGRERCPKGKCGPEGERGSSAERGPAGTESKRGPDGEPGPIAIVACACAFARTGASVSVDTSTAAAPLLWPAATNVFAGHCRTINAGDDATTTAAPAQQASVAASGLGARHPATPAAAAAAAACCCADGAPAAERGRLAGRGRPGPYARRADRQRLRCARRGRRDARQGHERVRHLRHGRPRGPRPRHPAPPRVPTVMRGALTFIVRPSALRAVDMCTIDILDLYNFTWSAHFPGDVNVVRTYVVHANKLLRRETYVN